MHYREYNPSVGRWLSQDPIGISARDSNYYGYAKNRPAIKKDPLGLADEGSDFGNPFIPYPDYWAGQVEASFNGAKAAGEIVAVGGGVAASGIVLTGGAAAVCPYAAAAASAAAELCYANPKSCSSIVESSGSQFIQTSSGESSPTELNGNGYNDIINTAGQAWSNIQNTAGQGNVNYTPVKP
jgi:uncharacterized protein RhaS with RHS repeats